MPPSTSFHPTKAYRHLFFDLDHTLWDFEKNANETLRTLFVHYDLARFGTFTVEEFISVYSDINHALWRLYQSNKISQQQLREHPLRAHAGASWAWLRPTFRPPFRQNSPRFCPRSRPCFPSPTRCSGYLQTKLPPAPDHEWLQGNSSTLSWIPRSLRTYFQEIITSEHSGYLKPDPRMFEHALERTGATAAESLMIGDNLECDVLGAYNAGIDQVYFNPEKRRHFNQMTHEISCLSELKEIL